MTTRRYRKSKRAWRTHLASVSLLSLGLLLHACGGGGSNGPPPGPPPPPPPPPPVGTIVGTAGGTVTSADGMLSLDIPQGALSSDTDIVVTKLSQAELDPEFPNATAGYRLEPDGLQFATPVRTTLSRSASLSAGILSVENTFLWNLDVNGIEILGNQVTTVDASTAQAISTGDITHFSEVYSSGIGEFFEIAERVTAEVGDSFVIPYGVKQIIVRSGGLGATDPSGTVTQSQDDIFGEPSDVFDLFPVDGVQDVPFTSTILPLDEAGDTVVAEVDGLCVTSGEDTVLVLFRVEYEKPLLGVRGTADITLNSVVQCDALPPPPPGPSQSIAPVGPKPEGMAIGRKNFRNTPEEEVVIAQDGSAGVYDADTLALLQNIVTGGEETSVAVTVNDDPSSPPPNSGILTGSNFNSKLAPSNLSGLLQLRTRAVFDTVSFRDILIGTAADQNLHYRAEWNSSTGMWEYTETIGGSLQGGANFFPGATQSAVSYLPIDADRGFTLSQDGTLSLTDWINRSASNAATVLTNALRMRGVPLAGAAMVSSFDDGTIQFLSFDPVSMNVNQVGPVINLGAGNNPIGTDMLDPNMTEDGNVAAVFTGQTSGLLFHVEVDPTDVNNVNIFTTPIHQACVLPSHAVFRRFDNGKYEVIVSCSGSANVVKIIYDLTQMDPFTPPPAP